jgi:hypothetical protein
MLRVPLNPKSLEKVLLQRLQISIEQVRSKLIAAGAPTAARSAVASAFRAVSVGLSFIESAVAFYCGSFGGIFSA